MTLLVVLTSLVWTVVSGSTTKTWIANTNYWNGDNWNLKRIPCLTDRVLFPVSTDSAVYLHPGTTAMRELVLPRNGELILPPGQLLVTGSSGQSSAGCPGEDMVFTGGQERAWLNSSNWRRSDSKASWTGEYSPVPHAERIPCPTDRVVFPDESSYKVKLPEVPVTVGSIYIQGESTTTEKLQRILQGNTGYHLFKGDADRIIVQGETCSDPMGCICNNHENSEIMEALCTYEKSNCREPKCDTPIRPVGHCCKICGAIIFLEIDASRFSQESVTAKLSEYPKILTYVSRLDKFKAQIVLREEGLYKGDSSHTASKIAEQLKKYDAAGILSVKLLTSGEPITALGSTSNIVLVILIIIVIFVGTAALLVFGYRRHRPGFFPTEMPSFHFRRFENASGPGDGEVEIAKQAEVEGTQDTRKAFDNPMFDNPSVTSSVASTSGLLAVGLLARPKVTGRTVTLENPTYKALQASVQRDLVDMEDVAPLQNTQDDEEEETPSAFRSSKYEALREEE